MANAVAMTSAATKPPPGAVWPRKKISTDSTTSTGATRAAALRSGMELSWDWPNGRGRVPASNRWRGMELTTAAMTTAAMPSTDSSPNVSKPRNSTMITATMLSAPVTSPPSVRYHSASSERPRRPVRP